ncbi:hypothetical protein BIU97_03960 [Curtobacterium sp. MCBA15_009]|nr:hypothetical protein BIU97_03960 [Curtobacterium sp. MCBA15_009]
MLFGLGSVVLAVAAPHDAGVQTGFIASSIGITAIVTGGHAVKVAPWGATGTRAFGRGGAILGGVGTALMLYALIAFALLPSGVRLPALALPAGTPGDAVLAGPAPTATPMQHAATPTPAETTPTSPESAFDRVPVTVEQERSAVVQSAGTLAYVMQQRFGVGPFPAQVAVDRTTPQRVMLLDGTSLAPIPVGARVLYSASPDGSSWTVTVVGGQFGAVATYSSAVGTVQAG